jgi:hypothetical protein
MLQLQSGIFSLRRENLELQNDIAALKQFMESGFATINGNVRRVAIQPACRVATATGLDFLAGQLLVRRGQLWSLPLPSQ